MILELKIIEVRKKMEKFYVDEGMIDARVQVLEWMIKQHNQKYWEQGEPEIDDAAYDLLVRELKELAPNSTILTSLEVQSSSEPQSKYVHSEPMLSLEKFYSKEALMKWVRNTERSLVEQWKIELKLDGISGRLENGFLVTRGDGKIGEDHTSKIPYIEFRLGSDKKEGDTINGEIVITDKFFEENLSGTYKNSRNAVAGLVGKKHPEEIKGMGITFIDFDHEDISFTGNADALEIGWDDMIKNLTSKGLPFDGIVIKLADSDYYKQLGNKTKSPKGAVAYKFANKSAITRTKSITWQVSRKGKLTPVCELVPIDLDGTTISRATAHNHKFVKDHGITNGSSVMIERAGGVIPKIIRVIESDGVVDFPDACPCCDMGTFLIGVDLFCPNPRCPDRIIEQIVFMAKIMDIDELGRPTASKLYQYNYGYNSFLNVLRFNDIEYDGIIGLGGYGEKSANVLYSNIRKALYGINEIKFLASFGVSGWGRTMVNKVLSVAGNLPSLFKLNKEELMAIEGVGEKLADNLVCAVITEEIDKIYTSYCEDIVTPLQEHNNMANPLPDNVYVLIDTPKGQYKLSARLVAEQRADYYACFVDGHAKGSEEWVKEVKHALVDNRDELSEWLLNNSDWEDWEAFAEKVNDTVNVSENDFWTSYDGIGCIEEDEAIQCKSKTICFTGKMPEKRKFYEDIAIERGLTPSTSVSKELDILVISEAGWTSGKVKKAEKYGTEIISLKDWL